MSLTWPFYAIVFYSWLLVRKCAGFFISSQIFRVGRLGELNGQRKLPEVKVWGSKFWFQPALSFLLTGSLFFTTCVLLGAVAHPLLVCHYHVPGLAKCPRVYLRDSLPCSLPLEGRCSREPGKTASRLSTSHVIIKLLSHHSHLIHLLVHFHYTPMGYSHSCDLQFTEEKTGVQRGLVICSRLNSSW